MRQDRTEDENRDDLSLLNHLHNVYTDHCEAVESFGTVVSKHLLYHVIKQLMTGSEGNINNYYMMPSDSALPLVHYDHMTSQ